MIEVRRDLALIGAVALIALAVGGCSLLPSPRILAVPEAAVLHVVNGTTLTVTLVVDGATIREIGPTQGVDVASAQLPPLPWNAEVRTVLGRVLLRLTVNAGDVSETSTAEGGSSRGAGRRVDLSCGRIDIWSGPPMLGPAPRPGTPGDCAP
jgi:hypothetical protein